jgi:hypothetical protein
MSYASENKRPNPASMALAIGLNGSIILAVALSPVIVEQVIRDPFEGRSIPVEPLPPKQDEKQAGYRNQTARPDLCARPGDTKDIPKRPGRHPHWPR